MYGNFVIIIGFLCKLYPIIPRYCNLVGTADNFCETYYRFRAKGGLMVGLYKHPRQRRNSLTYVYAATSYVKDFL